LVKVKEWDDRQAQEDNMKLTLDKVGVQETIRKSSATSYGLSLVVGLPFPAEVGNRIRHIQRQLEALLPGRFTWYPPDHLHATLYAPLRGRYRDFPALQREELPSNLQGFTDDLVNFFAQRQPFSLELAGVHVTDEGSVMVGGGAFTQQLASNLQRYPELDSPKGLRGLHVTIGFFNTDRPFTKDEERMCIEMALTQFMEVPVGRVMIWRVWLVHYANRTLNRIVGKIPFTLGQANTLTGERLLQELGIAILSHV
jgi:2'-5' RNA ligase